jgi:hypothetical protein
MLSLAHPAGEIATDLLPPCSENDQPKEARRHLPECRAELIEIRGPVRCLGGPSIIQEWPLGRPEAYASRPGQGGEEIGP